MGIILLYSVIRRKRYEKKLSLILLILIFILFTNGCVEEVSLIETKGLLTNIYKWKYQHKNIQ